MDPELAEMVARAEAVMPAMPEWPAPRPAPGEDRAAWAARVARLRAQHDAHALLASRLFGPAAVPAEVASVTFHEVPAGDDFVAARVYVPHGDGPFAAVLVFHGGAFWMGGGATGFELNDGLCRGIADTLGAVVVNVDYRLAPEHPFPVQTEDGYAALQWVHDQATALRVDPARVGLFGISSGGNVAAVAAMMARDRGGPAVRAQLLLAPAVDLTERKGAISDPGMAAAAQVVRAYYAAEQPDLAAPYLSPAQADDLTGMPPAVVVTGELDPLRAGGRHYVQRLTEAGVEARNLDYPMTHTIATPAVFAQFHADLLIAAGKLLG